MDNTQARTNPVFLTAKTAICLMAQAGIPDAAAITRCLGLEKNEPLQAMPDADTILGNAVVVEAKYRTMCRLIENSGYHTCVDLPCGYTPKAIHLTKKNFRFIGLDLPVVVQEVAPIIYSLVSRPKNISFYGVDATNYESLETALSEIYEPICISTEGMMMYFTENEVDNVISNIRALLNVHGGCWITPDPEFKIQFRQSFCSIFGENSLGKMETAGHAAIKQSKVANLYNSFIADEKNLSESIKTAENLLASHGLKAEKINLAENMPALSVYDKLTPKQILQFKDAMRLCNYWFITLDDTKNNFAMPKQRPFEMSFTLENKILQMTLIGRVDSISAPKILTTWEAQKSAHVIDAVKIDCAALDYISTAGVRVLAEMRKSCSVALLNVSPTVSKILAENGFTI